MLGPLPVVLRDAEPFVSARLVAVPTRGLYSRCLEKRSRALQACNLTRNIQADGVPMVHWVPGEGLLQGSFFTIGHRSYASENAPDSRSRRHFPSTVRPRLRRGRMSSIDRAIHVAQPPIGDSPRRSMKIRERSENTERVQSNQGDWLRQRSSKAGSAFGATCWAASCSCCRF